MTGSTWWGPASNRRHPPIVTEEHERRAPPAPGLVVWGAETSEVTPLGPIDLAGVRQVRWPRPDRLLVFGEAEVVEYRLEV